MLGNHPGKQVASGACPALQQGSHDAQVWLLAAQLFISTGNRLTFRSQSFGSRMCSTRLPLLSSKKQISELSKARSSGLHSAIPLRRLHTSIPSFSATGVMLFLKMCAETSRHSVPNTAHTLRQRVEAWLAES